MTRNMDGYATDIPYLRDFKPMLAPAWLDHVALVAGVEPPARQGGFGWCDLGCGQGVTAAILAATHPDGMFHGIDAMTTHVDHARRLAAEAKIPNVCFDALDFAAASDLDLPPFDYIVTHGVYTWIGPAGRRSLLRFIDCHLKPGGLVYVGYNAMPGWARDLPFQRLVQELGRTFAGDSAQRFAAAAEIVHTLADARVPSLAGSFIVEEIMQRPEDYVPAYLVHEFMPAAWQPLYVTEMRAAMAGIGLTPVGSATLSENLDWMVLDAEARKTLAAVTDENIRELVRDFYLDQRFRRDVFARDNRRLSCEERAGRLFASTFALARPVLDMRYRTATAAGSFVYDTPSARAIVEALEAGPRSLAGSAPTRGATDVLNATDILNNVLTLCAADDIWPVEPGRAPVGGLNRALCRRLGGPEEIRWLALPCGTARQVDGELLRLMRDGEEIDEKQFPGWRAFLAAHGLALDPDPQ